MKKIYGKNPLKNKQSRWNALRLGLRECGLKTKTSLKWFFFTLRVLLWEDVIAIDGDLSDIFVCAYFVSCVTVISFLHVERLRVLI